MIASKKLGKSFKRHLFDVLPFVKNRTINMEKLHFHSIGNWHTDIRQVAAESNKIVLVSFEWISIKFT